MLLDLAKALLALAKHREAHPLSEEELQLRNRNWAEAEMDLDRPGWRSEWEQVADRHGLPR